jgi:hypothetical protein
VRHERAPASREGHVGSVPEVRGTDRSAVHRVMGALRRLQSRQGRMGSNRLAGNSMSAVSAALMKLLLAKGLSAEDIVEIAEQMEADTARIAGTSAFRVDTADRRRTWDRERKAAQRAAEREARLSGGKSGGNPPDSSASYIEEPSLSKSVEGKRRKIKSRAREVPLPDEWTVTPERRARLKARGASDRMIDDSADAMRSWAHGKGIERASWDATHDGFVMRDLRSTGPPQAAGANGKHSTGIGHAKTHNLLDAAAALHERLLAAELQDGALPAELRSGAIEGDAWFVPAE